MHSEALVVIFGLMHVRNNRYLLSDSCLELFTQTELHFNDGGCYELCNDSVGFNSRLSVHNASCTFLLIVHSADHCHCNLQRDTLAQEESAVIFEMGPFYSYFS